MYLFGEGTVMHLPTLPGHTAGAYKTGRDEATVSMNVAAH